MDHYNHLYIKAESLTHKQHKCILYAYLLASRRIANTQIFVSFISWFLIQLRIKGRYIQYFINWPRFVWTQCTEKRNQAFLLRQIIQNQQNVRLPRHLPIPILLYKFGSMDTYLELAVLVEFLTLTQQTMYDSCHS